MIHRARLLVLLAFFSPPAMAAVTLEVGDVAVNTLTTTSDIFGNPLTSDTLITVYN